MTEKRDIRTRNLNNTPIIEYPKHQEEFEQYYSLGKKRKLKEVAKKYFHEYNPDCLPGHPDYDRKFSSFYTKIKRWASKEAWKKWIVIKREEERRLEQESTNSSEDFIKRLKIYQSTIRDALDVFGYKVGLQVKLKMAAEAGDNELVKELQKKIGIVGEIKIDNFNEAQKMLGTLQTLTEEIRKATNPKE